MLLGWLFSTTKVGDYWAISGSLAPISDKGELNIYSNQNIKAMEEILSARASSLSTRIPLKSVASLHEDFCALKDCNSTGSGDSGALSGSTDNGTCGNENCNRQSLKSINTINTRKPVIHYFNSNETFSKRKALKTLFWQLRSWRDRWASQGWRLSLTMTLIHQTGKSLFAFTFSNLHSSLSLSQTCTFHFHFLKFALPTFTFFPICKDFG